MHIRLLLVLVVTLLIAAPARLSARQQAPGKVDDVLTLQRIPQQGLLLTGWRFHEGDSSRWAAPAYDDSRWKRQDSIVRVFELLGKDASKRGWLRLRYRITDGDERDPLVITSNQYFASEIFVDGRRLARYGRITANANGIVAWNPVGMPAVVPSSPGIHTLAVRCVQQPGLRYQPGNFSVRLNRYSAALAYREAHAHDRRPQTIVIGVFFILCILHLTIYGYYPDDAANLWYGVCMGMLTVGPIAVAMLDDTHLVSTRLALVDIANVCYLGCFFFIVAVHRLFEYRNRRALFVVGAAMVLLCVVDFATRRMQSNVADIVPLLMVIESFRISVWAYRRKKRGAVVLLTGLVPVFLLSLGSALYVLQLGYANLTYNVMISLSGAILPVIMSIILAMKFSTTNRTLKKKLDEVEQLSADNLEKEREKQQLLAEQNDTLERLVADRTTQLNQSLEHLKATQGQLIHAEKMASLGELTAGIAHEIQNPLNFVNNFSEVSRELLGELREELIAGNTDDVLAIAGDLEQNLEKIGNHGKRADNIVKGMLQHSRAGSGVKETTDVNALADECLRLSYHGLRAKDKSFNAEIGADLDPTLPKIDVIPQDLSRVLLNLINNAFQAAAQRQRHEGPTFQPKVSVSTRYTAAGAEITVTDNGAGVNPAIREKIFQPFFTTKPTGEGTGLGLSLSYDIVVKGHGGELELLDAEDGAVFRILLPVR